MEKVTGIGGVFFRARQPKALSQWYCDHLGVDVVPANYGVSPVAAASGPNGYGALSRRHDVFRRRRPAMDDQFSRGNLDAMVAQLRAAGISVEVDAEKYPNGHFARLYDPEGNAIELWEPAGRDGTPGA